MGALQGSVVCRAAAHYSMVLYSLQVKELQWWKSTAALGSTPTMLYMTSRQAAQDNLLEGVFPCLISFSFNMGWVLGCTWLAVCPIFYFLGDVGEHDHPTLAVMGDKEEGKGRGCGWDVPGCRALWLIVTHCWLILLIVTHHQW